MSYALSHVLAEYLAVCFKSIKTGILVVGFPELNSTFITDVLTTLTAGGVSPLYCCTPGISIPTVPTSVTSTSFVESAVAWRNDSSLAGHLLVMVADELQFPKLHSLAEFERVTPSQIRRFFLEQLKARAASTDMRLFWEALRDSPGDLSLAALSDFATATPHLEGDPEELQQNLWRLGFFQDTELLHQPALQINRHRALLLELQQLSKTVRVRMVRLLVNASTPVRLRHEPTYHRMMTYYSSGNREALRELELQQVAWLIQAGKDTLSTAAEESIIVPKTPTVVSHPLSQPPSKSAVEGPRLEIPLQILLTAWGEYAWYQQGYIHLAWVNTSDAVGVLQAVNDFLTQFPAKAIRLYLDTIASSLPDTRFLATVENRWVEQGRLQIIMRHFESIEAYWANHASTPLHLIIWSGAPAIVPSQWYAAATSSPWLAVTATMGTPMMFPPSPLMAYELDESRQWFVWNRDRSAYTMSLYKQSRHMQLQLSPHTIDQWIDQFGHTIAEGFITLIRASGPHERAKVESRILLRLAVMAWYQRYHEEDMVFIPATLTPSDRHDGVPLIGWVLHRESDCLRVVPLFLTHCLDGKSVPHPTPPPLKMLQQAVTWAYQWAILTRTPFSRKPLRQGTMMHFIYKEEPERATSSVLHKSADLNSIFVNRFTLSME